MGLKKELKWTVGYSESENSSPAKRVPAEVPGAVQLDWAKAEGWGAYTYADNWKDYLWMEDMYWSYTTNLDIPQLKQSERIFFVSKGIDYRFKIKLGGEVIFDQEGMFTPFELDLTGKASQGDELEVLIFPAPKREGAHFGRQQADQCCKPPVSYGWDWHPRLIPLGIWDDTYLEVRSSLHLIDSEAFYNLKKDFTKADISLSALLAGVGGRLVWTLIDRNGKTVGREEAAVTDINTRLHASIDNPELWWPNGHGEPVLYTSRAELFDEAGNLLDSKECHIGFRTVQLVMYPGAWGHPEGLPKSRSNPPITMEVNGRQIFCKGTNWVNPEIFPGIMTEDTYRPLVTMAKEANMNLFRSWGGGIINKESFFNLCDEMGIMVWQEFPLACNDYEGTAGYLKVLDQESRSIIKRLRRHASLVLWCGGNELFNGWSGMTDQSLALRLLNRNCYDLDPRTPFIPTSPLDGMGHGNYLFRNFEGEEVYHVMPRVSFTAYTEFGCPGMSSADYLRSFIPKEELFPPKRGTAWQTHHAFDAWWPGSDTWLAPETLEHYFGTSDTLEELAERSQLLQSEGYKCIYEEARRQKPRCSMALNWCYNEPWPTAVNNSLINWPAEPKPAYFAVKESCRPVLASARIPKFTWKEGELFNPEMWILNDSYDTIPAGRIEAYLELDGKEIFMLAWDHPEVAPNKNLPGPVIRFPLPEAEGGRMALVLKSSGNIGINSRYTLLYRIDRAKALSRTARVNNL